MSKYLLFPYLFVAATISEIAIAEPINNRELFDIYLIGLEIKDSTQKDVHKKYHFGFDSSCYGGSSGIYINSKKQLIYIARGFDEIHPENIPEFTQVLTVTAVSDDGDAKIINATSPEYGAFNFTFSRQNKVIFNLQVTHSMSGEPDGWSKFEAAYINVKNKNNFSKEDCGGFDG